MTQNYEVFFSIELLHEYFLNRKCNDLAIIPSSDCHGRIKSMNMQARVMENRLVAFIKVNELNQPFINVPPVLQYKQLFGKSIFRFYIKMRNPLFLNYTNVELSSLRTKAFYFSNLTKNSEHKTCYLTRPIQEYVLGEEYLPGSLVREASTGYVYEAIRKHTAKKKTGLSDGLLWVPKAHHKQTKAIKDLIPEKHYDQHDLIKKPNTDEVYEAVREHQSKGEAELENVSLWKLFEERHEQYSTEQDLVEYSNGVYLVTMPAVIKKATIDVLGFNYDLKKPAYDVPVLEGEVRTYEKPVSEVKIDLSSLEAGRYEIKVNKEVRVVYYDPVLKAGDILGVIEIFNHLDEKDDYALLADEEKVTGKKFLIQFPNRRVLWKYKRKDNRADKITDTTENGYLFNLRGDDFVSAMPIPLSENVIKTLRLDFNTKDFRLYPLPNPVINHFTYYNQDDYDYLCSEMFLNY